MRRTNHVAPLALRERPRLGRRPRCPDTLPGMRLGLGTGSTARYFTEGVGRLVQQGVSVTAVCTSKETADLARSLGITVTDEISDEIDVVVDGADEIDPVRRLLKGRGGALTREKLVAVAAGLEPKEAAYRTPHPVL